MKIKLGVIGFGGMGKWHAQNAPRAGVEVVAVCDIEEKKQREAVRRFWKKVTVRRRKFSDMQDDRSRVRYAYRALIRSKYGEDWSPDLTPSELGRQQNRETLRQLTETYNLVRYDPDKPVPPDYGEQAARAVREMGSR